ncbi:MAG: GNAT family N-acetyltransferase [Bacteroidota bacterium]
MTDGLHTLASSTEVPTGPVDSLGPEGWAARPEAHVVLIEDRQLVARASVWWMGTPEPGVGVVGHASWENAEMGQRVLEAAMERLRVEGCTRVLGPMDGSTWRSYRVVVDPAPHGDAEPPFASEPFPPSQIGEAFELAEFGPIAHYVSARVDLLPDRADLWAETQRQLEANGITVRTFNTAQADLELARLYPLIRDAFAGNLFYTPLPEAAFLAMYAPLVAQNDPVFMLIAEREDEPIGFHFGFPDLAQAARGESVDTIICKTLAVSPSARGQGLGGALTLGMEEAGRQRGLPRALHALMHEANDSLKISRHGAQIMRRYALLGREL